MKAKRNPFISFLLRIPGHLGAAWRILSKPAAWNRKAYRKWGLAAKLGSWAYSFFLLLLLGLLALEINFLWLFGPMPGMREVREAEMSQASEIYSADGKLLGKYYTENRSPVPYDSINPVMVRTLIAVEDIRFYQHAGIDFKAIGAALADAAKGNARGASTITQQLAKNLFKTRTDSKGLLGYVPGLKVVLAKGKEWITALKLELFFSKQEILALYLNTVDFGRNSFGIKSAAKTYFNTTPLQLKPQECAVLVGMLKAPTYYNPVSNPKNATKRRNLVLDLMVQSKILNQQTAEKLKDRPIQLKYKEEEITDGLAPYFRTELAKWLRDYLKKNYGDRYNIYTSGLRIETTLDSRLQVHGESAVGKSMRLLQKRFNQHWQGQIPWSDANGKADSAWFNSILVKTDRYKAGKQAGLNHAQIMEGFNIPREMELFDWDGDKKGSYTPLDSLKHELAILQCGLMAIDPFSGQIKMWVGGINFSHYKYDHVKQMSRQPGSTFKPFVYATAFEKGLGPCDKEVDSPVKVVYQENGETKEWAPRNADWQFSYDEYTLRRAMAKSINTIAAKLTERVGAEAVAATAKKMGISSYLEPLPALGLGSSDVSLFDMVGAYAVFMNRGEWIEPHFVSKVYDRKGNLLFTYKPERRQAISEETAFLMTYMLRGGIEEPGGTTRALWEWPGAFKNYNQVGGKTGTSQNYSDGWFMGVVKDMVVGCWVGADQRRIHFRNSQTGEGSKTALPVVGRFLELAYEDVLTPGKFPAPREGVVNKPWNCLTVLPRIERDSSIIETMESIMTVPEEGNLDEE